MSFQPNTTQQDLFTHQFENNVESQKHYEKFSDVFGGQCLKIMNWLMEGKEVTVRFGFENGIASTPRRVKDLTDKRLRISTRWAQYENGMEYIIYYLTPEDKEFNQEWLLTSASERTEDKAA